MKILRAEHLGMCFGVRDAIALALEQSAEQPLTILGDLVHNETVVARLRARGIRVAQQPAEATTPAVLITAHGASDKAREAAAAGGRRVLEATCPLVQLAHRALGRLVAEGFHPVVIGQRGHVEVRGLTEDYAEFDVVLSEDDVAQLRERPRFGVVAQTTQPIERARHLVARLRQRFPRSEVRFVDTVCQPTKLRQHAAVTLARRCDVVIVIGGAASNNTRELAATCQQHCARVHHVQTAADLRAEWFFPTDRVGVTAGTSTPDEVIDGVEHWLRVLAMRHEPARPPGSAIVRSVVQTGNELDLNMNPTTPPMLSSISNFLKQRAIFFKMAGVTVLVLLLLIPLGMIHSVLRERWERRDDAVAGITAVWGQGQSVIGPVLIVPYRYTFKSWKEQTSATGRLEKVEVIETAIANAYFLPATLNISGEITPKELRRGIYRAVVYSSELELSGEFARPDFDRLRIAEQDVLWDEAMVGLAVPDLRGVTETLQLGWGDRQIPLQPGSKLKGFSSGIHARIGGWRDHPASVSWKLKLTLNGSGGIRFTPVAERNRVQLKSPWPDPSFQGAFLPSERTVDAAGFAASWQLSQYGRDYAQQWTDQDAAAGLTANSAANSLFGVDFLSGIDAYRTVERATKYGVLFMSLVFTAFFLFEMLSALRIHPFQYALVGAALCLFYLSLLSLSEFIAFGLAYLAAAAATTLLIWFYCAAVLKSGRRSLIVAGLLTGIYGFLYVTLQLQDYSLLAGSTGLFIALALVFLITRKINWYARDQG